MDMNEKQLLDISASQWVESQRKRIVNVYFWNSERLLQGLNDTLPVGEATFDELKILLDELVKFQLVLENFQEKIEEKLEAGYED